MNPSIVVGGFLLVPLMLSAYIENTPPILTSVSVYLICTCLIANLFFLKKIGVLVLIYFIVLMAPFIHIAPYILFDFGVDKEPLLWEMYINPYMLDEDTIKLTAAIGAIAAISFLTAAYMAIPFCDVKKNVNPGKEAIIENNLLSMRDWSFLWIIGFILSWISSGGGTIFSTGNTVALSWKWNFASAWMFSYAIFAFLFSDAIYDNGLSRRLKLYFLIAALFFIVVYLQIMKGDRESFPFIFGVVAMYLIHFSPAKNLKKLKYLVFVSIFIYAISLILGVMRSEVANTQELYQLIDTAADKMSGWKFNLSKSLHGTWSAVLLTVLSIAGDDIRGLLTFSNGSDYIDLFKSIIPGFFADFIGYERPIDSYTGPAWKMRYGIGGTHATVLPYMNFGMIGVFFITITWSLFIVISENKAMKNLNPISISYLIMMITCAPHWIWYGEKSLINTLIMWIILSKIYEKLVFNNK